MLLPNHMAYCCKVVISLIGEMSQIVVWQCLAMQLGALIRRSLAYIVATQFSLVSLAHGRLKQKANRKNINLAPQMK